MECAAGNRLGSNQITVIAYTVIAFILIVNGIGDLIQVPYCRERNILGDRLVHVKKRGCNHIAYSYIPAQEGITLFYRGFDVCNLIFGYRNRGSFYRTAIRNQGNGLLRQRKLCVQNQVVRGHDGGTEIIRTSFASCVVIPTGKIQFVVSVFRFVRRICISGQRCIEIYMFHYLQRFGIVHERNGILIAIIIEVINRSRLIRSRDRLIVLSTVITRWF